MEHDVEVSQGLDYSIDSDEFGSYLVLGLPGEIVDGSVSLSSPNGTMSNVVVGISGLDTHTPDSLHLGLLTSLTESFGLSIRSHVGTDSWTLTLDDGNFNGLGDGYHTAPISARSSLEVHSQHEIYDVGSLVEVSIFPSDNGTVQIHLRFMEEVNCAATSPSLITDNGHLVLNTDRVWQDGQEIEMTFIGFQSGLEVVDVFSNTKDVELYVPSPSLLEAGRRIVVNGNNFDHLRHLTIDGRPIQYDVISSDQMSVILPSSKHGLVNIEATGFGNSRSSVITTLKPAWKTANFRKPIAVLYEDGAVSAFTRWETKQEDDRYIARLSRMSESNRTEVSLIDLGDQTNVTFPGLNMGETYELELLQFDNYHQDYVLVDAATFVAENDGTTPLSVSMEVINAMEGWETAEESHGSIIGHLEANGLHEMEIRSLLQAMNHGRGFNDSDDPYASRVGIIITVPPGGGNTPGGDTNPGDDEDEGGGGGGTPSPSGDNVVFGDCHCELIIAPQHINQELHRSYEDMIRQGSLEGRYGWYDPIVSYWQYNHKKKDRTMLRSQRAGAAAYREALSHRRGTGASNRIYLNVQNQDFELDEDEVNESVHSSEIVVRYDCVNTPINGTTVPCTTACVVPSVFRYDYSMKLESFNKEYGGSTDIEARIMDCAFVTDQKGDGANPELIDGNCITLEMTCLTSFNTEWWQSFVGVLSELADLIDFEVFDPSSGDTTLIDWGSVDGEFVEDFLGGIGTLITTPTTIYEGNCDAFEVEEGKMQGEYIFDLVPNQKRTFAIHSTQSIAQRAKRGSSRVKSISDFSAMITLGRDSYANNREQLEICCMDPRSAYIVGSHEHLWKHGISNPHKIDSFALEEKVQNTYSGLLSSLHVEIATDLFGWFDDYFVAHFSNGSREALKRDNFCSTFGGHDEGNKVGADPELSSKPLRLYPNPAENLLYVELSDVRPERLNIYDVNGGLINQLRWDGHDEALSHTQSLDISLMPSGLYIVEVVSPHGRHHQIFVKY